MEAQLQARRSAEDTRDLISDLTNWTAKQKAKDEALIKEKASANREQGSKPEPSRKVGREDKLLPQNGSIQSPAVSVVEGANPKTIISGGMNGAAAEQPKAKPTKGFFGGPSKVNRRKAASRTSAQAGTPRIPDSAAESVAEGFRQDGNEAYKRGDLKAAESFYTRSIAKRASITALANRAVVFLKTEKWVEAEEDCTAALELPGGRLFVKAWQRRGTARRNLERLLDAAQDFDEALRLEPENQGLQKDRDACLQLWVDRNQPPPPGRRAVTFRQSRTATSSILADDLASDSPQTSTDPNQAPSSPPGTALKGASRKLERHRPASQTEPDPELLSEAVDPSHLPPQPPGIEVLGSYPLDSSRRPGPTPAEVSGTSASEEPAERLQSASRSGSGAVIGEDSDTQVTERDSDRSRGAKLDAVGYPAPTAEPIETPHNPGGDPAAVPLERIGAAGGTPGPPAGADDSQIPPTHFSGGSRGSASNGVPSSRPKVAAGALSSGSGFDPGAKRQEGGQTGGGGGSAGEAPKPPAPLAEGIAEQLAALGVGVPQAAPPQSGAAVAGGVKFASIMSTAAGASKRRPPTSGTEFEVAWRGLRGNLMEQAAYVKILDPDTLENVFKQSMTGSLLASLATAALHDLDQKSLKVLLALPKVPRFDMAAMAMASSQKRELKAAWTAASSTKDRVIATALEGLRFFYRV